MLYLRERDSGAYGSAAYYIAVCLELVSVFVIGMHSCHRACQGIKRRRGNLHEYMLKASIGCQTAFADPLAHHFLTPIAFGCQSAGCILAKFLF